MSFSISVLINVLFAPVLMISHKLTDLHIAATGGTLGGLCTMLRRNDLIHFDSWASTFGETVTAIELAPEGTGYRAKTRFARFYNLPELMSMIRFSRDTDGELSDKALARLFLDGMYACAED